MHVFLLQSCLDCGWVLDLSLTISKAFLAELHVSGVDGGVNTLMDGIISNTRMLFQSNLSLFIKFNKHTT
jgi:hypothetical protein